MNFIIQTPNPPRVGYFSSKKSKKNQRYGNRFIFMFIDPFYTRM